MTMTTPNSLLVLLLSLSWLCAIGMGILVNIVISTTSSSISPGIVIPFILLLRLRVGLLLR